MHDDEDAAGMLSMLLDGLDSVVSYIDGVVAEHTVVPVLGVDVDGKKHLLRLWEDATENGSVCWGWGRIGIFWRS